MTSSLNNLALLRPGIRTKRVSSYDHSGGNNDFVPIGAGETKTLAEISGAGIVKHIWITIACADPLIRRNAILRMFWDGETHPSVEAPLGDFFGQGWGEKYNYASLPLAAAPAGGNALNCYFPMPFGSGARIEVENQSDTDITNFYCYVDFEQHSFIGPEMGRFHAWWNRQRPGPEAGQGDRENEWETLGVQPKHPSDVSNHVLVHAEGAGHYVGVNYFVDSPTPLWYGEGDDMFLVDGEPWPGSLHGTGTEDYFNASWCPKELYAHPYFGYARVNGETGFLGRTHCYRFHLEDPVYFEKSLRASIEHGHANSLTLDLATVAYWYQTEPHRPFQPIGPKEARQPMPPIGPLKSTSGAIAGGASKVAGRFGAGSRCPKKRASLNRLTSGEARYVELAAPCGAANLAGAGFDFFTNSDSKHEMNFLSAKYSEMQEHQGKHIA